MREYNNKRDGNERHIGSKKMKGDQQKHNCTCLTFIGTMVHLIVLLRLHDCEWFGRCQYGLQVFHLTVSAILQLHPSKPTEVNGLWRVSFYLPCIYLLILFIAILSHWATTHITESRMLHSYSIKHPVNNAIGLGLQN